MRILIDGDACPKSVKQICQDVSREYDIPAYIVSDRAHDFDDDEMDNIVVDTLPESLDHKLINLGRPGDIVVTHDYGLAAIVYQQVLAVIHPNGFIYSENNIELLLYQRYMKRKHHQPGRDKRARIKKRSPKEDQAFKAVLFDIISPVEAKAPFTK